MYIFGGINSQQERFNDIFEFVYETKTWTRVITIGNAPTSRTFHQMIMYQGYMYVIGGFDGMKRNDIYKIKLSSFILRDTHSHALNPSLVRNEI